MLIRRLPSTVLLLLWLISLTFQTELAETKRHCEYVVTGELCLKKCCGIVGELVCVDICDGVRCYSSVDCDGGCCVNEKCVSAGCEVTRPKATWYVVVVPVISVLLIVVVMLGICCVRYRRAAYPNRTVITTVFRTPPPAYAQFENEDQQGLCSQALQTEMLDLPPPYKP